MIPDFLFVNSLLFSSSNSLIIIQLNNFVNNLIWWISQMVLSASCSFWYLFFGVYNCLPFYGWFSMCCNASQINAPTNLITYLFWIFKFTHYNFKCSKFSDFFSSNVVWLFSKYAVVRLKWKWNFSILYCFGFPLIWVLHHHFCLLSHLQKYTSLMKTF